MGTSPRSLDEQIEDFMQEFEDARIQWEQHRNTKPNWYGYSAKPRINYDPEWDGLLIERLRKLEAAGFTITRFYRKQKIVMRLPTGLSRAEVVARLEATVGSDFIGVTFKPFSVWWKGGGYKRPYGW